MQLASSLSCLARVLLDQFCYIRAHHLINGLDKAKSELISSMQLASSLSCLVRVPKLLDQFWYIRAHHLINGLDHLGLKFLEFVYVVGC